MNSHYSVSKYLIVASISILLLSSAAHAMQLRGNGFIGMNQNSNSFGSFGDVDRTARQFRSLGLSDDQRQQLWAIADSFRSELREQQDALGDGHEAIREMLVSENYDAIQLSTLANKQGDIIASMIEKHAEMVRQMGSVLTSEQVTLFLENIQSRSKSHAKRSRLNTSGSIEE